MVSLVYEVGPFAAGFHFLKRCDVGIKGGDDIRRATRLGAAIQMDAAADVVGDDL